MWRGLFYLIVLAGLASGAAWLSENPGTVTIEWRGYLIETPFGIAVAVVAAIAAAVAMLYCGLIWLSEIPARYRRKRDGERCRRGYLALTRGLVAVAAGDAVGVNEQSWKVGKYLKDPPLELLLAAQAAQLAGDEDKAARHFHDLLENPETEFFGLRGLIVQALKKGAWEEARLLAERAHKANPRSEWVASSLLALQARSGRWGEAQKVLAGAAKTGQPWTAPERQHHQAVVAYQLGMEAVGKGDNGAAQKHLRKALELRPDFVAAASQLGRLLADLGKTRKATTEIEAVWRRLAHADLFEALCVARGAGVTDALERAKAAQRLARLTPDSAEAHAVAARALLDAMLWGEARKHLTKALELQPTARIYRMLAEVEEREPEQGDADKARTWLVKASTATPDPAWVCGSCGGIAPEWAPVCPHCHGFDTLSWTTTAHGPVVALAAVPPATALPAPRVS